MDTSRATLTAAVMTALLLAGATTARAYVAEECAEREGTLCDESDAEEVAALAEPAGPEVSAPLPPPANDTPYEAAIKNGLGAGNWGVEFILVEPAGRAHVLSQMNHQSAMVPASTMKLFTGWFGFIQDQAARRRFPSPFGSFLSYAGTMLRSSVNPMASYILKTYGGATSMLRFLTELGLPTDALTIADGSGLRHSNRASARAEVALLEHILRSPHYMEYRALMAQPGSTGTLRSRMPALKGSLYAKTGTLPSTGVVSLAGFIDVGNAGTVVFAIIGNNSRISVANQRNRIDSVVVAVRDLAAPQPGTARARAMRVNDDFFARLPSAIAASGMNP